MRLWSLNPCYLDAQGLTALWREGLLARAVLAGQTRGYRNHPQLLRFRGQPDPLAAINAYLHHVHSESRQRGYRFDAAKLAPQITVAHLTVTTGQLAYELSHLLRKLAVRSPELYLRYQATVEPQPHPLFEIVDGPVEPWEVIRDQR